MNSLQNIYGSKEKLNTNRLETETILLDTSSNLWHLNLYLYGLLCLSITLGDYYRLFLLQRGHKSSIETALKFATVMSASDFMHRFRDANDETSLLMAFEMVIVKSTVNSIWILVILPNIHLPIYFNWSNGLIAMHFNPILHEVIRKVNLCKVAILATFAIRIKVQKQQKIWNLCRLASLFNIRAYLSNRAIFILFLLSTTKKS